MTANDERGSAGDSGERPVVYCLVPEDLAPKLHDLLRRHFRDAPEIEVIVECRWRERRSGRDRRGGRAKAVAAERRLIRAREGRRVAERRASQAEVEPPELPRRARRHAGQLRFVERSEPSTEQLEDADTARVAMRFQAGDGGAFDTLYSRYFDRVYGYLTAALNDAAEAEDATQEVFIRVLEKLPEYERRRQPFRAWLFKIVRNLAVDELRRRAGRPEPMSPDELPEPPAAQGEEEEEEEEDLIALAWVGDRDLLMLMERLPAAQQQVLTLRFALDLGPAQIAELLDRTPADVRTLQSRGVAFLRDRLRALGREPKGASPRGMRRPRRQQPALRSRRFALDP